MAAANDGGAAPEPSTAPTALAVVPQENVLPLRPLAEQANNLVPWTEDDRGGHFAAMEQPTLLVADLCAFFRKAPRPTSTA